MSLHGIFDPMVRAHFENKYAGGGACEKKSITVTSGAGDVPAPFSELIGLEVVDIMAGRMFLSIPTQKPRTTGILLKNDTYFEISYDNYNEMLSKPCLLVSGSSILALCPHFFADTTKYQALIYAFEEVTDTMGLGLTFTKGWHAVNVTTFANEPFDPDAHPFVCTLESVVNWTTVDTREYVIGMFVPKDVISFTVKPENLLTDAVSDLTTVSYTSMPSGMATITYESFCFYHDSNEVRRTINGTALITYI